MLPNRVRADLILLLVALIWGSAFAAQRVAAPVAGVFLFNGARFLVGALILLPFAVRALPSQPLAGRDWRSILLLGLVLTGAAGFQQLGLRYTTAANAGFVTGLYVVILPLLLTFIWRQPVRPLIWPTAAAAGVGLFLLSTGGRLVFNPGDAAEFLGAILWAFHLILIERLVRRIPVLVLAFGQFLVSGVVGMGLGLALEGSLLSGLVTAGWAVLYVGIFSTGLGYTLQVLGQKTAPAVDAAIILSLEAVFAALFGWLLLSETLTPVQLLGGAIMFGAMILSQIKEHP
jgi:drug/metabolite transporter (DMT)-like permease